MLNFGNIKGDFCSMNVKKKIFATLSLLFAAMAASPAMAQEDVRDIKTVVGLKDYYEKTVAACEDETCKVEALRVVLARREAMYLLDQIYCSYNPNVETWTLVPEDEESYCTDFFKAEVAKVPDSLKGPTRGVFDYFYNWQNGARSAADIKALKLARRSAELDKHAKSLSLFKTKSNPAEEKKVRAEVAKHIKNKVLKVLIEPDWVIERDRFGDILRRYREVRTLIEDPLEKGKYLLFFNQRLTQDYHGGGKYSATRYVNFDALVKYANPCYGVYRITDYK